MPEASRFSAQIELHQNGDFMLRSNCVETVCRRINSDDSDGDGLPDDVDPNPTTWDGNYLGTSVAWYNAQCGNVLSAWDDDGVIRIEWNDGVCSNAYYWLDLVVAGARGRETGTVRVTCDGHSNLGDMTVIARTNEVCHIPLLAGAWYIVESDLPIASVTPSDSRAYCDYANIPGKHARNVWFPLAFNVTPQPGTASHYVLSSSPLDVGAAISSASGLCCNGVLCDGGFDWTCGDGCHCGGGHNLWATATWEGYSRGFLFDIACPCVEEPEAEVPSLCLSLPRVLFTNNNGGAEDSDIVELSAGIEGSIPTNVTLRLDVYNSEFDIKVWSASNRTGRVTFPLTWNSSDCTMTNLYVEGGTSIPEGVNFFRLDMLDGSGHVEQSATADFAVYCPVVDVINSSLYDNGDLCNPSGIVTGTNACFAIEFTDFDPPAQDISWSIVEGNAYFVNGQSHGKRVRVASDTPDQWVRLQAQVGDCRSRPIEMRAFVVEPLSVKLTVWIVGDDYGTHYAEEPSFISNMVVGVNKLYEQIGAHFYIDTISFTNRTAWLDLMNPDTFKCDRSLRMELVNTSRNTGGLELHFVDRVARNVYANHNGYGIAISSGCSPDVLAHEIGHAFGCADIYYRNKLNGNEHLPAAFVCEGHAPLDWSNGDGCRYYRPNVSQEDIIQRLLMCGVATPEHQDLSIGSVYGFSKYGDAGLVDVGMFRSGCRRQLQLHR